MRIRTIETFDLAGEYAALLVAPARLTRRGIVVPDVGHVDPGFEGEIRLTLINMGRHPYDLEHGDSVVTALLFRLNQPVAVPLRNRQDGEQPYNAGLRDIEHLSFDFLNIEKRVKTIAENIARIALGESGWKYAFFQWCLPILVGVLSAFLTYHYAIGSRLDVLESKASLSDRFADMEQRLRLPEERKDQLAPGRADGGSDASKGGRSPDSNEPAPSP